MDFDIHCMFILPTELSLFNYDKVKSFFAINRPCKTPAVYSPVRLVYVHIIQFSCWMIYSAFSSLLIYFKVYFANSSQTLLLIYFYEVYLIINK